MVGVATFDCRTAARGVCRSRGAGSRKRSREWTLLWAHALQVSARIVYKNTLHARMLTQAPRPA